MSNECQDLKNIKYKTMLLNGNFNNNIKTTTIEDSANIDDFLEKEKLLNKAEQWNKLDKTIKLLKLKKFADNYIKEENLSTKELKLLQTFFANNLDQKKLLKSKDVIYDKTTGQIKSVPCLVFNNVSKKFTLKRCEKRQSTLKSLAPKKKKENIKLVDENDLESKIDKISL